MKRILSVLLALMLAPGLAAPAQAAGLEQGGTEAALLFEDGTVLRSSFTYEGQPYNLAGLNQGWRANARGYGSLGFKTDIGEALDVALIFDQPFGADLGFIPLLRFDLDSYAVSALARYRLDNGVSLIGGARLEKMTMDLSVAGFGTVLEGRSGWNPGLIAGIGWENATSRLALTYSSGVRHRIRGNALGIFPFAANLGTPPSLRLEGQTAVSERISLDGALVWIDWTGASAGLAPLFAGPIGFSGSYRLDLGADYAVSEVFRVGATAHYDTGLLAPLPPVQYSTRAAGLGLRAAYDFGSSTLGGALSLRSVDTTRIGPIPIGGGLGVKAGISLTTRF